MRLLTMVIIGWRHFHRALQKLRNRMLLAQQTRVWQIGTATPLDYNLSSIQKSSVLLVNVTVSVSPAK